MNAAAILLVRVPRARPGQDLRLLDHLRELQVRTLSVALAGVALAFLFFGFGVRRLGAHLAVPWPSASSSVAAHGFRALAERFTPPGVELVVTSPLDGVVALFLVALVLTAFALTPVAAWQVAMFLGPALRANERRAALASIPVAVLLFAAGVAFGFYVLVPTIFEALYGYAGALEARLLLAVPSLVSFAAVLLLVFGLSFELPLVMIALSRVGAVAPRTWVRYWRHAVLAIAIVAAVATPDPTVVSQVFVAVPLLVLYLVGAAGAFAATGRPA